MWKVDKLNNIVTFGNGKVRPKKIGAYPVYGGNGILGFCDNYNYQHETIIIGRVGAYCGSVYYENKPIWVSDNALAAKPTNNYDTKFIYYFLKNLGLNKFAEGSSHPLVTQTLLNSIEVRICIDLNTQKRIAEVFSALEGKINLLNRQNETIEKLTTALFKQFFADEKDNYQKLKLAEVISVKGGTTPSTTNPEFWNGTFNWTSPKDLSNDNSIFLFDTERKITQKGLSEISSGLLPTGTVLLSSRAPIGYLAITEIPVAINQGYIAIICDKIISNYFMFLWCKAHMGEIENAANGSVFQEISKSSFKELDFLMPPETKLNSFEKEIIPFFEKIKSNIIQIKTLTQLRNLLLPKLMTSDLEMA